MGFIISYPVAGYLNRHLAWETTFYITGMTKFSLNNVHIKSSDMLLSCRIIIHLFGISLIPGVSSIVWSFIFFFTVADYPSQDKFMKKVERNYFLEVHNIAPEEKVM